MQTKIGIHNEELEQDILYCFLWYKDLQPNIYKLDEDDFYKLQHRELFNEYKRILAENKELNPNTISPNIVSQNYYKSIMTRNTLESWFKSSLKKLKAYSNMRKISKISQVLSVKAQENIEPTGLAVWAIDKLDAVMSISDDKFKEQAKKIDEEYEEMLNDNDKIALKTGYYTLDKITRGFYRASLNVIASAQGMGKTSFILNLIRNICGKQNKSILFMPLEMEYREIRARLVCLISGVDFQRSIFDTQSLLLDEIQKINKAREEIDSWKLYMIGDEGEIKPVDLELAAKAIKGIDIIMVDYLQQMQPNIKTNKSYEDTTNLSKELKRVARRTGIPVVAISSINRDYSKRDNKKPRVSDLRESGQIEYDAGLILLLHRECKYRDADFNKGEVPEEFEKEMELIVGKSRFSEDGMVIKYYFEGNTSRIYESYIEKKGING